MNEKKDFDFIDAIDFIARNLKFITLCTLIELIISPLIAYLVVKPNHEIETQQTLTLSNSNKYKAQYEVKFFFNYLNNKFYVTNYSGMREVINSTIFIQIMNESIEKTPHFI